MVCGEVGSLFLSAANPLKSVYVVAAEVSVGEAVRDSVGSVGFISR
jgi:hypothetical protein